MAAGMMGEMGMFEGTALAFLDMTWKFHAPIVVGDSIRVRWWVSEKRETRKPERGVITRSIEVYDGDVLACTGTMTSLWSRRTAAAAA
jgi:acyl dehydratase